MTTQYDRAVESLVGRDVWKIIPVNSRESILIASSLEKVAVAIKRILRCPMENVFVTSKEAVAVHIGAKGTISTHKFLIEKVKLVETVNHKGGRSG